MPAVVRTPCQPPAASPALPRAAPARRSRPWPLQKLSSRRGAPLTPHLQAALWQVSSCAGKACQGCCREVGQAGAVPYRPQRQQLLGVLGVLPVQEALCCWIPLPWAP